MSAEWWRAYRLAHREAIGASQRRRRQDPRVRAQRHAQEQRRRQRRRAEDDARTVPLAHPLLSAAAALVPMPKPGTAYRWTEELAAEDARSEAVLAMLEGSDPATAVRAWLTVERTWLAMTCPLAEWNG